MIFTAAKAKLMQYIVPVSIIVLTVLVLALGFMSKLYLGKVEEVNTLNIKIATKEKQIENLNIQINLERQANANVDNAEAVIETKFIEVQNEVTKIPTDPDVDGLDIDSVADVLCNAGLAEPSLCTRTD